MISFFMDVFANNLLVRVVVLIDNRLDHIKDPSAATANVLWCGAKAVVHFVKAMALALDNHFDQLKV